MYIPTKAEKRATQLHALPVRQQQNLEALLGQYDVLRKVSQELGLERSFIEGIQTDVTGYGSIKDTHEKIPAAPAA